ncbi:MarR family transcriptional regulator [candidate division WOR-3 bacterium]|nr:MarR family transcriptional regulator [candidate division WOR-3 bacterium]
MARSIDEHIRKLEELGPVLVKGMQLVGSAGPFGAELSFSQFLILQTLLSKDAMRMNELALTLGLSKANVTGLVDRMVRSRLLERMRSDEDRRVVYVTLSVRGRRIAQRLINAQRREFRRIMEEIPPRNLDIFIDSLEQLAKALMERRSQTTPIEED